MMDGQVRGNDNVRRALAEMVDSGHIPHALMFHEDDGGGAMPLCLWFMEYLFKSPKVARLVHPDVHFIFPVAGGSIIPASAKPSSLSYIKEWRSLVMEKPCFTEGELNEALGIENKSAVIAVAEAKGILEKLAFNSLEGGWQAVLVYLPEKMTQETANRLLKSIEEPPARTEFVFITHAPEKVLTTISSRCQLIRVVPEVALAGHESPGVREEGELFRRLLAALASRDLLSALEVGESIAALPSRERLKSFCRTAGDGLRQMVLVQQGFDSFMPVQDVDYWRGQAGAFRKQFPRVALACLDRANMLVERNVNQKIIFTDLVNRLYETMS